MEIKKTILDLIFNVKDTVYKDSYLNGLNYITIFENYVLTHQLYGAAKKFPDIIYLDLLDNDSIPIKTKLQNETTLMIQKKLKLQKCNIKFINTLKSKTRVCFVHSLNYLHPQFDEVLLKLKNKNIKVDIKVTDYVLSNINNIIHCIRYLQHNNLIDTLIIEVTDPLIERKYKGITKLKKIKFLINCDYNMEHHLNLLTNKNLNIIIKYDIQHNKLISVEDYSDFSIKWNFKNIQFDTQAFNDLQILPIKEQHLGYEGVDSVYVNLKKQIIKKDFNNKYKLEISLLNNIKKDYKKINNGW